MTREEAKAVFLNRGYVEVEGGTIYNADKWRESCRVISEWLEQEPCEDAISRKALISHIENQSREWGEDYDAQQILGDIEDMPSVNPQPNTGLWIKGKCDQCGGHAPFWSMATTYYESEYCPNCGAKMVEPQEREE